MPFDGSTIGSATSGRFVGGVFSDTTVISSGTDVDMIVLNLQQGRTYKVDIDNGTAGDL